MAGVQRKDLKTISEFTVDRDKINLIEKYKEKIERLYEVEVKFDNVNETESKQWIIVEGENIDRMSAKEYMLALCDPQESQVFQINCDALDEDMLEQIEKQTNAVLQSLSDYRIEIRGTELAVILAMSSLEDVLGKHESVVDVDGATQQAEGTKQTTNNDYTNNEPSHWSRQLDTSLRRALSQNGDFNCSVDDYNSASTSVKQVILSCMNHRYSDDEDMDDSVLFAGHSEISDGASSSRKYKVPIFVDGRQINRSPVKDLITEAEESPSSSNVTSLSDQFNQTIISPEKRVSSPKPTIKKKDTPDQQYLRQFGLSVGYSEEEVEEGLEFVDEKTKPADFLELLSGIKSNKESNSGDEANDSCLIVSSSFPAPPKIDLSQKQDGARRSLPDEYKQRLIKDFSEEHEHLSVAELKRRNEERQKMLQEAFENKQIQNSGGKGKKRKNKNKNKDRLNSPSGRNQSKQNKGQTQNQQKGKQTPRDGQNTENHDDEETCVLRTWEDDDGDNCSDNDCTIVGHDGPTVPTVYANYTVGQNQVTLPNEQPWQQQSSPSRHTWQQVPSKNQPRQQMQPNPRQPWKQQQQSPRQQQFRQDRGPPPGIMPLMEVDVNPALMGAGRDDLRYIVVDGSNVAMTHGNGKCYSCKGIKIVIDYFIQRGHKDITAFVPLWRTYKPRPEYPISDQNILNELKESGHLVFTPSRRLSKKFISSYDDRFVLQLAEKEGGIIVSNDQYRDLMQEKSSWRKIIEEKLLMYTFVKDNFMPPNDPLGRDGPCLDEYLRKSPRQSLRKRHLSPSNNQDTPNTWKHRDQRSSNDQRWTRPQQHYNQPQQNMINYPQNNYPVGFHPVNIPPPNYPYHHSQQQQQQQPRNEVDSGYKGHNPQQNRSAQKNVKLRSEQQTNELFKQLKVIFSEPDQVKKINEILQNHPAETNMEKLTNFCINAFC